MRTLLNRLLSVIGLQAVPSSSGLAHAKDDLEARIYSICNDADERGIAALSLARRLVVLAWGGRGIIGNGGFKYFYEAEWRGAELAAAYRALGFTDAADACDRSLTVFPDSKPPEDHERRNQYLDPDAVALLGELDRPIFAIKWDDLKRALGAYMERHPSDFP